MAVAWYGIVCGGAKCSSAYKNGALLTHNSAVPTAISKIGLFSPALAAVRCLFRKNQLPGRRTDERDSGSCRSTV
jgi:hypothetical protein